MNNDHIMEVDFSKEIKASMKTQCDACGATLGEHYPTKKGSMTASLRVGKDNYGYDSYKTHHFCGEACMRAHLNDRHDKGMDEDSLDGKGDNDEAQASQDKKKVADHKSEYGDVEYADPKNHKYPIDSEEHVRAAWSYINMPKNQKGYSPDEVASIKKRIKSKFSKYGINDDKKDE